MFLVRNGARITNATKGKARENAPYWLSCSAYQAEPGSSPGLRAARARAVLYSLYGSVDTHAIFFKVAMTVPSPIKYSCVTKAHNFLT